MLKLSQEEIVFMDKEQVKNLIITNHFNQPIIYKLKTNNLSVVEASPNYGFMNSSTSLSILVKSLHPSSFKAKLQLIYTTLQHNPGQFSSEWASLSKSKLVQKQIKVTRVERSSNGLEKIEELSSGAHEKEVDQWEQMYKQERVMNNKLKQQLDIVEVKLKDINEERLQLKMNKSIGIICEEYHTSFTELLLLGVFCFVTGFILSKLD